ncbi:hypothetical protein LTR64_005534 [Lithohypha guttulata]|uniref:Mso1 N-terminal domain-containing protein n=1 Tax=Lithohypha guttulata TaxID=1690604 RepID=A0AAN7SWV2_9EURO|nr:hypothetical protein LTR51_002673 [Lithohypha guttulata]KAK5082856.1 hypothetical protein LTR05_006737 [Lithohypha guttulata]
MASYLSSYFSGGTSSTPAPQYGQYQPQYQQYQQNPQQAQPGATWSSTFSSRIGAIKKVLARDNEEDDPDNEDCSHVSNVLRAYYTEKGRPFPEWLPPDPRKPVMTPAVQQPQHSQYGNMYPSQYGNSGGLPHSRGNSGGRGGGLSDLWDPSPVQAQPQAQVQSLRAPRPNAAALKSFDSSSSRQSEQDPYATQARPLPSQRVGSYQNIQPAPAATPASTGNPRDRLRARLQGSGSGRSSPATGPQSSYNGGGPNLSASQPWSNDSNSYDAHSSGLGNPAYQQRPGNYR